MKSKEAQRAFFYVQVRLNISGLYSEKKGAESKWQAVWADLEAYKLEDSNKQKAKCTIILPDTKNTDHHYITEADFWFTSQQLRVLPSQKRPTQTSSYKRAFVSLVTMTSLKSGSTRLSPHLLKKGNWMATLICCMQTYAGEHSRTNKYLSL